MQLVINSFGAFLHKYQDTFRVKIQDRKFRFSPKKIESILVTTGTSFSSDAVAFAIEHNIDFIFLNQHGNPYARIWRPQMGSTALIRRKQLELAGKPERFEYVKELIDQKFANQISFLKGLQRARKGSSVDVLENGINSISGLRKRVKKTDEKDIGVDATLRGLEGSGGRTYFSTLSDILPDNFQFAKRTRDPAEDYFNCLLNYGYGMLYGMVERACILAGVDPHIGFLHTDNYNKPSFVFDIIEPFRPFVDEVVTKLITTRQVKQAYFDEIPGGYTLNDEGKKLLIPAVNDFFEESIRYRGRNIQRKHVVQFECHRLANDWIGRDDEPDVNVVETRELEEVKSDKPGRRK